MRPSPRRHSPRSPASPLPTSRIATFQPARLPASDVRGEPISRRRHATLIEQEISELSTYHFIGSRLIETQGNRASHEAYFIGDHRPMPGESSVDKDVLVGGRSLSVVESRDGAPWLFLDRTVVNDWSCADPVVQNWPMADRFRRGQAGRADLVGHLLDPDRRARP